ncbi:MAG: MazG nucleotide pyrophosphohydrolase domain-containing protein [Peptoniphilus sp.]|nr:MazG nucleotide pyrophosphohydrolase domain-containing protein [Peptoniphilus sp.]MDD7362790.1 MazG nucleotide pyrophosphohydrolase domain-containing protein [Bacillota bacterium]MDY6044018.1 MazG nucleotide pyrophosphohydrolase domain-containing protein [Peptoniphilus sp.]
MGNLRIVGLGPTDESGLTAKAIEAIEDDSEKFLRTEAHDAVNYFRSRGIPYTSYDHLYETMDDFDSLYRAIADDLIERSETCKISYFVPGHPLVAEKTVVYLLERDPEIEIVDGLSFIEPILDAVKKDPVEGLVFLNGDDFTDLDIDIHKDMIVTQVYNQRIARELKLTLSELYGDEHAVYVLSHAGHPKKESVLKRALYQLDRFDDYGFETSLYVPKSSARKDIKDVVALVRRLRGPEGCSWDRRQTHESMNANLVEEAYEAAYAIRRDDSFRVEEELGDVLFQVIFHSEIAAEEGTFTLQTISEGLIQKMVNRHPHVFGGGRENWDALKEEETGDVTASQKLRHDEGLPALMRGAKALRRVDDENLILEFLEDYASNREEGAWIKRMFELLNEADQRHIEAETALDDALGALSDYLSDREDRGN